MNKAGGGWSEVLFERDREIDLISGCLDAAVGGDGRAVIVDGPAGIGKSALLAAASEIAESRGFHVLTARGDELERDHPWGIAVQLLRAVVGPGANHEPDGAARLALSIFSPKGGLDPHAPTQSDDPFPVLHGLHWLTVDLAEREPLLIVVDDLHWGDAASLRFVNYIVRRLEGVRVAVVAACRTDEPIPEPVRGLLARLHGVPTVTRCELPALTTEAIAGLVRRRSPDASTRCCTALADAVIGNPFYCSELVRSIESEGFSLADDATAARIRDVRPAAIRNSILVRMGRLGSDASVIAGAVAVLGAAATVRRATRLSGLDSDRAVAAIDALVDAAVLVPRSAPGRDNEIEFVHPVIREVVHGDLGPARRGRDHLRCARLLDADGADPDEVADHLMIADECGERWAIAALAAGARAANASRSPEREAALLDRAAAMCPDPDVRAELLVALGRAELGLGVPTAGERLDGALASLPHLASGVSTVATVRDLGNALYAAGRFADARSAFGWALDMTDRSPCDPILQAEITAGLVMAGDLDADPSSQAKERLRSIVERPETVSSLADRVRAALAAGHLAFGADPPLVDGTARRTEHTLALARAAIGEGTLPAELGPTVLEPLTLALVQCDEFDAVLELLDPALARSAEIGDAVTYSTFLPIRGFAWLGLGELARALGDASDAIRLAGEVSMPNPVVIASSQYVAAVAALGSAGPDAAVEAIGDFESVHLPAPSSPVFGWHLQALGCVRLALGQPDDALEAFLAAGQSFRAAGGPGDYCEWRIGAADAAAATGDASRAEMLAAEELDLAERFGAPRSIARALRCSARNGPRGAPAIERLQRAAATLEGSPARLELAHVEVDLGSALRRSGYRTDARAHLRRGLADARRCGAWPLVDWAVTELESAGATRPRLAMTGVEALTPAEARVARRAAAGQTNRAIAEQLFVTRKTVEVHLTSVYRKLGIGSRGELSGVLDSTPTADAGRRPGS